MLFFSWSLIGPQVTWSIQDLWLINPPSLPNLAPPPPPLPHLPPPCWQRRPRRRRGGGGILGEALIYCQPCRPQRRRSWRISLWRISRSPCFRSRRSSWAPCPRRSGGLSLPQPRRCWRTSPCSWTTPLRWSPWRKVTAPSLPGGLTVTDKVRAKDGWKS